MHPTKNDLPADSRAAMVALLNARLADALDLYTHAKQAHWNVKGPNFVALHGLFDDVSGHSLDWADTLAERAVALGGQALGTAATVAKTTALPTFPTGASAAATLVESLATSVAAFGAAVRAAIDTADAAGDKGTSDLFTGLSREADKDLWMLEAHRG